MAARKAQGPTPPTRRELSADDIERGIAKFRRRIEEVQTLDPNTVAFDDAKVDNVESNIRTTISDTFGPQSPEFAENGHLAIWHGGYNIYDTPPMRQHKFANGIPQTVTKLEGLIARLEEMRAELPAPVSITTGSTPAVVESRRVFVVHGRDNSAKETVARFLGKLDLEPVILHEQPNQGRTVIEKFEDHADVAFAVVLLTPDDVGGLSSDAGTLTSRGQGRTSFSNSATSLGV